MKRNILMIQIYFLNVSQNCFSSVSLQETNVWINFPVCNQNFFHHFHQNVSRPWFHFHTNVKKLSGLCKWAVAQWAEDWTTKLKVMSSSPTLYRLFYSSSILRILTLSSTTTPSFCYSTFFCIFQSFSPSFSLS